MVSSQHYGADAKGATYIIFGKAGGFTDVTLGTSASSDWIRIDGAAPFDASGGSVAALGDINGDGFDDVLIGSPNAHGNGRSLSGISYVVYGNASGANQSILPASTPTTASASSASPTMTPPDLPSPQPAT